MIESRFFTGSGYILRDEVSIIHTFSPDSSKKLSTCSPITATTIHTCQCYQMVVVGPLFIMLPNNEEVMGKHSIDRYSATDCWCQRE